MRSTRAANPIWLAAEGTDGAELLHLHPGDEVPGTKYRVVRRLGSGGMGVVYEGQHQATERRAALKVLRRGNSASMRVLHLFRQEARIASQIGSEYIVQSLDFAELADGRLVYIMELVDGISIADLLAQGPLQAPRAIGILRQVARGLADAHAAGVVHRDVKPENVMLERKGDRRDAVRILDFGIATVASKLATSASDAAGTPEFLAPELILGGPPSPSSDLYSLGCMAYEMLTGRTPFCAADVDEVLRGHLEDEPRPIVEVPRRLSNTILLALRKQPEQRHSDMQEFEAALIEAQIDAGIVTEWDHLPVPAVDPDRRAALVDALGDREPTPRTRWLPSLAVGASLVGLGALGWLASEAPTSDSVQSAPAAAAPTPSIEQLTRRAREAAANGRYIYPPHTDPRGPTAYREILALEALDTPSARARASELRLEFAGELRRVADHYHARSPASPLVAEFYAEVLTFLPSDEVARARAQLSPERALELRRRASAADWDAEALLGFEPLAILGEKDSGIRQLRVAKYREAIDQRDTVPMYSAEFDALLVVRSPFESGTSEPTISVDGPDGALDSIAEDPTSERASLATSSDEDHKRAASRLADAGRLALHRGKTHAAQRAFEAALELNGRLSSAHDGLGQIFFSRSNFQRAAKHAKKAVRLSPGNLDYRVHLGDALYRLGSLEQALEHYVKAAEGGRTEARRRAEKIRAKL